MKLRLLLLALIALLLLALGASAVACGDDGEALEEYFRQLSEAKHELGAGLRGPTPPNAGTTLSEEQQLQALADSFTEGIPFVEHFLADLESLFEDADLDHAGVRFVETCVALQDFADEKEIDVDVDCD